MILKYAGAVPYNQIIQDSARKEPLTFFYQTIDLEYILPSQFFCLLLHVPRYEILPSTNPTTVLQVCEDRNAQTCD